MKVLFIDDEPEVWAPRLHRLLEENGSELAVECNPSLALQRIAKERPEVVLLDSLFRDNVGRLTAKGSEILARIHQHHPRLPVVMFTTTLERDADESDFPHAIALFGKQMFELSDGDPDSELFALLKDAVLKCGDNRSLDERLGFVVGTTAAMRRAANNILMMGPLPTTVLVHGETGTGKELAVRALHRESGRKGPLLAVDCGVLDGATLDSELFGHEQGAFTDARRSHEGLFQQASGGTLFLDEMPAMSSQLQDKLVRAIESKCIRRLGGSRDIPVDVRVIAASNRPISGLIEDGRFRHDLYQRLSALELHLPPLRERLADLPALFRTLIAKLNCELNKRVATEPREDVIARLATYDWPGNIRQLENVLRTAMVSARANVLTPSTIRLPEDSPTSTNDTSADSLDLSARILAGTAGWEELLEYRGGARFAILVKLYAALADRDGRQPGSKDLASLLGTTDDNFRKVVRIKDLRQAAATQI